MTISPLADETARGDADLARAAAGGDRTAFAAIYDRYADRLFDFCVGMLRDRDAAADCVQDVFVTAATRLAQLREHDRLRPWLYAIARNEALARIQHRRREHLTEDLPEMASNTAGLDTMAARSELAALIDDACGGLSDRDRTVFELAYRHGLDGPELADALGVSHTNANTLVGRLRDTIERSLGALLVSRRARAVPNACPELVALLGDWDGRFTVLMRKRVGRHLDNCATCDDERRRMVNPVALLGGAPVFVSAPAWLRQSTLSQFPSAIAHAGAPAVAGGAHAALAQQSWWPPQSFDSSDLGVPHGGPGQPMHPGAGAAKTIGPPQIDCAGPTTPAKGIGPDKAIGPPTMAAQKQVGPAPKQVGPAPKQVGAAPKKIGAAPTVEAMTIDSAHGHIGGHRRTALLVALVLLALGTVAVLGTVLVHQLWPPVGPAQVPTPAPAGTNAPIPSVPVTSVPPPVTSQPAPSQPIITENRVPTRSPATSDFPAPSSVNPVAPPAPSATSAIPTPISEFPPPPAPVIPMPNVGAGGPAAGVPRSSGGSSAGDSTGPPAGGPSAGGSGGSAPPITHKVFGGSGSTLNNCPVLTGCPSVPNTHGIH